MESHYLIVPAVVNAEHFDTICFQSCLTLTHMYISCRLGGLSSRNGYRSYLPVDYAV